MDAEMGAIVDAKMGVAKQILLKDKVKEKEEEKSKGKEESLCVSQSLQFKGFCLDSDKCAEVCKKESFAGGECKLGLSKRKCFCKKPC
jgi:hypothetical protein